MYMHILDTCVSYAYTTIASGFKTSTICIEV